MLALFVPALAWADDSKLRKEDVPLQAKATLRGKDKRCCGYPLVDDQQWALRFYWLAAEDEYDTWKQDPHIPRGGACRVRHDTKTELFTQEGFFFAHVSERFACALQ